MMTVTIPSKREHEGLPTNVMTIEIPAICPECGGPRGKVRPGISYDGSQRLHVDSWINPCGHVDVYSDVREEYRKLMEEKKNG